MHSSASSRLTHVSEADHTLDHTVAMTMDRAVEVIGDTGGRDEPDIPIEEEYPASNNNWLVPNRNAVDDARLKKSFEPDSVASSVVPSPMWGIRGFLKMGAVVGAFPADIGERYIHFVFEFCDTRTWYIMLFLLLWLLGGLSIISFCLISSTNPTAESLLTVKNNSTEMMVTSSDQAVLLFIPVLAGVFLPIMITLSWARVNSLTSICENMVVNGYRTGSNPEKWTMDMFTVRIISFLLGLIISNIHIALLYCDTDVKQLIFVVGVSLWVVPLYLAMVFLGYVINQLVCTLGLYFKHLRSDVVYKNDSLARNGYQTDVYDRMVKMGGMPKRLDRLIEEVRHVEQVYGPALYYDYTLHTLLLVATTYLSVATILNTVKTNTISTYPPWYSLGYILLATHHYLRMSMLCHSGDGLSKQLDKTLSLISQFAYVHNDNILLGLAIARKPSVNILSVAGYARLDRSTLSVLMILIIMTILASANYKIME